MEDAIRYVVTVQAVPFARVVMDTSWTRMESTVKTQTSAKKTWRVALKAALILQVVTLALADLVIN